MALVDSRDRSAFALARTRRRVLPELRFDRFDLAPRNLTRLFGLLPHRSGDGIAQIFKLGTVSLHVSIRTWSSSQQAAEDDSKIDVGCRRRFDRIRFTHRRSFKFFEQSFLAKLNRSGVARQSLADLRGNGDGKPSDDENRGNDGTWQ